MGCFIGCLGNREGIRDIKSESERNTDWDLSMDGR